MLLVVAGGTLFLACRKNSKPGAAAAAARSRQVVVLGCDGLDYTLVKRMLGEGRLPNLAKLRAEGGFWPLTTSIPPQSPVAWSNFITGAGPGVHGIFDFIHRDPTQQATPYFSTNRIVKDDEKEPWKVGSYRIPRGSERNELLRHGTPFWEYLDQVGVPVQMYRLPANYPPSPSSCGCVCCLAGMGVPDAFGSQGTYQHFSTRRQVEKRLGGGMKLAFERDPNTGVHTARVRGPGNEYRAQTPEMTIDVAVHPDPERPVAKLVYTNAGATGDECVELVLNEGEWSGWQELHFLKTPVGPTFRAMAQFYLQSVRPELELYVSPLNFIPTAPEAVISEPPSFVSDIGRGIGPFATLGFAEAFKARDQNVLSDEEFRAQAGAVLDEHLRMLDYALGRFQTGLLFFYFSSSDLQAHMFYWDSDEPHPLRTPEQARQYEGVLEDVYARLDAAVGHCREKLGADATILVLSDHGFANFRRGVGLNTWLRQEGYLSAQTGLLVDADWSRTRAYGLGLNGLYVNLRGREKFGIVDSGQREALLAEISAKLLALRDPQNDQPMIHHVYRTDECYSGPEAAKAPDLIVGYERGYRASWNTCLGDFDPAVVIDNHSAWSADHCIAHDLVPGVLFCNRPIVLDDPALIDLAPTVLAQFGLTAPQAMTGRDLLRPAGERGIATTRR
jgi:predicted AlkP superfamily phosphohydrolase/phosphomutase